MNDKERYEELIRTIETLIKEIEEEKKYQPDKIYQPIDILAILDGLTEYQE